MIFAMELILFSVNFLNRSGFSGRCMQPAANLRHTIHQPLRELLDVRLLAKGLVNHLNQLVRRQSLVIAHVVNPGRHILRQEHGNHKGKIIDTR